MVWFDLLLAVLTTAGVILIPGLVVSYLLGMRGLAAWALAAPAGTTILAIAAVAGPVVGLSWGLLPVALVAAAVAGAAALLRLVLWRSPAARPQLPALSWPALAALGAAMLVIVGQLVAVMGDAENISQTFDNIFHLNAIRYILDTGSASPLTIGAMTSAPTGGLPFYPSGWHAVASLVVQLTGVSIPVASNAAMVFFAAIVWPGAAILLVRTLLGPATPLLVTAAAATAALPAFPLLLTEYGVLFPYMMSLSMIAVPLALLIEALLRDSWERRWPFVVAALGTTPAIAIAHPGGLAALLLFSSVVSAVFWGRLMLSGASRNRKFVGSCALAAYALAVLGAWYFLRPPADARGWSTTQTAGQAIGEVLSVSVWSEPVNVAVAVLVAFGAVRAARRRRVTDWVILGFFAVAFVLYVVVSGLPYATPRDILTGPWYNNTPRLAALLPIAWVPLAAIGGEQLWAVLQRWRVRGRRTGVRTAISVAVAVTVLVVVPQFSGMRHAIAGGHWAFELRDDSRLLSTDERALLERLDETVPEDAVILGSPWTGTALAYALADRRVVMPHTLMDITDDMKLLLDRLDSAQPGSEVCAAVDRLGVDFVLDFGEREISGGNHAYAGLDELTTSDAVHEVDAVGDAVLYEVLACG